jgi:hypothetical protein
MCHKIWFAGKFFGEVYLWEQRNKDIKLIQQKERSKMKNIEYLTTRNNI